MTTPNLSLYEPGGMPERYIGVINIRNEEITEVVKGICGLRWRNRCCPRSLALSSQGL
jgi:hypothetical protein